MQEYTHKPEKVQAMQVQATAEPNKEIAVWCGGEVVRDATGGIDIQANQLRIPTLDGPIFAKADQYVVKDVATGQFYVQEAAVFERKFGRDASETKRPAAGFPANYPSTDGPRPISEGMDYRGIGGAGTPFGE